MLEVSSSLATNSSSSLTFWNDGIGEIGDGIDDAMKVGFVVPITCPTGFV